MDETPLERAQREAATAIEYAHMTTQIVCLLVADMQKAAVLRPSTKSEIVRLLREPFDADRSRQALERLAERMKLTTRLEEEEKRETPKDRG
jgi:hypothetical protein